MKISIDKIYSRPFDCLISDIPYIVMVEELLQPETKINQTKYYSFLVKKLKENSNVWGYIKSLNDCFKRTIAFQDFANDIVKNGYNERNEVTYIKKLPYGKLTFVEENGRINLVDGHHRISVLIYLGVKSFEIRDNYLIPIIE